MRRVVRFESADGMHVLELPLTRAEQEEGQSARLALLRPPLMNYAADLQGSATVVADVADIRHRAVLIEPDGADVDLDQIRALLRRIGRGKLWMRLSDNTERWCWARAGELASYEISYAKPLQTGLRITFHRLSDWYGAQEQQLTQVVQASPTNIVVSSQGTVATRKLILTLRPEPIQSGLTVSGTVITDALRSQQAPAHFDGRQPESSVGIWRGTTNLVTNGSFESNTNGWVASGSTISRDTTRAVHGSASLRVVTSGGSSGQGTQTLGGTSGIPVTSGQPYTASAWVSGHAPLRVNLLWFAAGGELLGGGVSSAFTTPGSSWVRLVASGTAVEGAAYAAVRIETNSTASVTFYVDAVQLENLPFPTPYVHTDGATASRSAGNLTLPAPLINALLDEEQGWVAVRFRPSLAPSQLPPHYIMFLFSWRNAGEGNFLMLRLGYGGVDNNLLLGSNPGGAVVLTPSVTPGQSYTAIAAWTPSQVRLSWNGGAFVTGTRNGIPDLSTAQANLGQQWNTEPQRALNGELLWVAMGKGTLTNADAAALAALGDQDPSGAEFPAAAQLTGLWSCTTTGTSIVKPKIENISAARSIQTLRTLNDWRQHIELDVLSHRARYSADGGQTWADDWSNIALGPAQADLLLLAPGDNLVVVTLDPTSVDPALWVKLRWHDAFA